MANRTPQELTNDGYEYVQLFGLDPWSTTRDIRRLLKPFGLILEIYGSSKESSWIRIRKTDEGD